MTSFMGKRWRRTRRCAVHAGIIRQGFRDEHGLHFAVRAKSNATENLWSDVFVVGRAVGGTACRKGRSIRTGRGLRRQQIVSF